MALKIDAAWSNPIQLKLATEKGTGEIYKTEFLENIPTSGGIYIFGRKHGTKHHALYIGKAKNLQSRLRQQFNSAQLMTRIKDSERGGRFLIFAEPRLKRGQKIEAVITVMEKALIAYSLSEGIELLQKMGTRRPNHEIQFTGNSTSKCLAPRLMRVGTAR